MLKLGVLNEKRCKKKEGDIGPYRSAATHPIGAQRRTLSERSDAPYRSAATHPIGAQRRSSIYSADRQSNNLKPDVNLLASHFAYPAT
jgi:hypothetical protein